MSQRIIECVPNFSEGRDKAVIRQITAAIEATTPSPTVITGQSSDCMVSMSASPAVTLPPGLLMMRVMGSVAL